MTVVTSGAVIRVPGYIVVNIGHVHRIVMFMAVNATEQVKVAGGCMTFYAMIPGILMRAAVNRKVLCIVVESGRFPCRCGVAGLAVCRESGSNVVGAGGRCIIGSMTSVASIRGVVIVSVVTNGAVIGNGSVCTC